MKQTAKFVRTRILPQHRDVLEVLLNHHRPEILKLLGGNKKMGYLVVGIKSALDGHQSREGHQKLQEASSPECADRSCHERSLIWRG